LKWYEENHAREMYALYKMRDIFLFLDIKSLFELVSICRKERPDVIHLNSSKAGGLGALAGRFAGVPRIVFTSHGLVYDEDRKALSRGFLWIDRKSVV